MNRRTLACTLTLALSVAAYAQSPAPTVPKPKSTAKRTTPTKPPSTTQTTPSGLTYSITHHGTGPMVQPGEIVLVHYTGLLTSGVKFDSSRDRNDPIAFRLGKGRVIKGWDEGIAKLHVGDQAVLIIPPALGYGEKGAGNVIPPGATLIFVVEVVDTKKNSLAEMLSDTLDAKGIDAAVAQFHELRAKGTGDLYTSESDINGLGYRLIKKKRNKEAIEILKLNVEAYPNSANSYDSLAEAYLADDNKDLAIENYKKAVALDPKMESSAKALEQLTAGSK